MRFGPCVDIGGVVCSSERVRRCVWWALIHSTWWSSVWSPKRWCLRNGSRGAEVESIRDRKLSWCSEGTRLKGSAPFRAAHKRALTATKSQQQPR